VELCFPVEKELAKKSSNFISKSEEWLLEGIEVKIHPYFYTQLCYPFFFLSDFMEVFVVF